MKRKNNLSCDDIDGQQSLCGLEITVRVQKLQPVKTKPINQKFVGLKKINISKTDWHIKNRDKKFSKDIEYHQPCNFDVSVSPELDFNLMKKQLNQLPKGNKYDK